MNSKFERHLVEQCAPTLAGIKIGSLFHYAEEKGEDINEIIHFWSDRLLGKGVRICCVRESPNGCLIYVFRPSLLLKRLSDEDVKSFLYSRGYAGCSDPDTYVDRLQHRFGHESCFPHEIGVFLGYPLQDIQGFIENAGKNFALRGLWKVYGERHHAERLFLQYRKCQRIYRTMFENGSTVIHLTVAACH